MKVAVLAVYVFVAFCRAEKDAKTTTTTNSTSTSGREKRFSLFNLVQFPNSECTLASSTGTNAMTGTCYTRSECQNIGGSVSGNCASGFGACCMLSVSACGSTIKQNTTYIQNPGFPTGFTTTGVCTYTFQANSEICQIRLDFNNFVLNNPVTVAGATLGKCATDSMMVTSGGGSATTIVSNTPTLCGTNTGQHIYFETGRQNNAGQLSFTIGTSTLPRTWKIKVTYIECGNPNRAPIDCTQYYTGPAGNFQSFNYQSATGTFLQNQLYNICFRQEQGFCTIAFNENDSTAATQKSFSLGMIVAMQSARICTQGGLIIPTIALDNNGGANAIANANNLETYCGQTLSPLATSTVGGVVTSTTVPFNIGVYSTNTLPGIWVGFNLMYMQVPC